MMDVADAGERGGLTARSRERFLVGETVREVRGVILSSWRRCQSLGLTPGRLESPYQEALDRESSLVRAAEPMLDRLQAAITGTRLCVGLADAEGWMLRRRVGEPALTRHFDTDHSAPGFNFTEHHAGTNGIGMALVERRPCHVFGHEHFAERWSSNDCVSVPIRNPLSGRIAGVLDVSCPHADANQALETMVRKAALAVERRLLEQSTERERTLLRAYLQARRRALVPGVPLPENPADLGLGVPYDSMLDCKDLLLLQEMATILIASGGRAAIEVPLSRGRVATLLAWPVAGSPDGIAVEVLLPDGTPQSRIAVAAPAAATGIPPQPFLAVPGTDRPPDAARRQTGPATGGTAGTPGAKPPGAGAPWAGTLTDTWPLAVGEPRVGRFAVAARRRLELLYGASVRVGTTLDVTRTAEELAEVAVPDFADFITVDLHDGVLCGDEPVATGARMRRVAARGVRDGFPFYPVGDQVDFAPATPQARCLASGWAVLVPDLKASGGWVAQAPGRAEKILEQGVHSLLTVPIRARGAALGVASFYRSEKPVPFEDDDLSLAEELVTRAAVCIDNARRYTREHTMALALQRSLLPRGLPRQNALEVAHRYLPAHAGVGGDWFDVIPLSGARVALVIGDVVGHGIHAAATMGRLRTAVHNFSAFDLPPDELLAHLDALVDRIDREENDGGGESIVGATCLYAIYDPTSRRCTLARAGHLPPGLVHPDGTVTFPEVPAGPPLGLGGMPFEAAELDLPEGSRLVLYTDGLVEDRERSIDTGLENLRRTLAHPDRSPEETCRAVIDGLPPARPGDDDVTLLVVRTRALDPGDIACWNDIPVDPAGVSGMRAAVDRQLADWGLEEVAFATELILSELLTNAIRHATGPLRVRLLRDRTLICEVFDTSSTSPRLRQATSTDEGGRGLFLVAQLAQRWGTRYTPHGKVIWTEQPLGPH